MKRTITFGRGFLAIWAIMLLSVSIFSACGANDTPVEEPDAPGLLQEETGSAGDYAGLWRLTDYTGVAPFAYIEIPAEDPGVANCYDENGNQLDTGHTDYSEQRALNGNALMVLIFQSIGEYGLIPFYLGEEAYMGIDDGDAFSGTLAPIASMDAAAAKPDAPATDSPGREEGEATAMLLYQGHGSLRITTLEGNVIYIDPYAGEGYTLPADLILITHSHPDHTAVDLIKTQNPGCNTITYREALADGKHQTFDLGYVTVEAVEAGNNPNHDITQCVGYLLTLRDGKSIYISGDTSTTEQMKALGARNLDYAFFCCDGRYNMDLEEASACAKLVGAKHSIPYHMIPGELFRRELAEMFTAENRLILEPGEELVIE